MAKAWDNNFNAFRLIAASSVIVNHAYALELPHGALPEDPLQSTEIIGWIAVNTFFVMSGYLIMSSLMRSPDIVAFIRNRVLRIFPGLIVCLVITAIVLGLFWSSVPLASYFSDAGTWGYLLHNATLIGIRYDLPGVFASNPYQGTVNGSLWTLPFELICYITAAILAGVGAFSRQRVAVAVIVAAIVLFACVALMSDRDLLHSYTISRMGRLGFCFFIGMLYAQLRSQIPLRFWHVALAGIVAAMLIGTPVRHQALSAALALLVLWLAFVQSAPLRAMSRLPDYSYGIYIYSFAIQQIVQLYLPGMPTLAKAALSFALVIPLASLSWHWIEKPALDLKKMGRRKVAPLNVSPVAELARPQ